MLLCFHRAFLFMLDHHPNVRKEMELKIKNFIESEDARHKQVTPDLGVFLAMVSVSEQFTFDQVRQSYVFESLDRKVLYMSNTVPELLDIENKDLDETRANKTFEATCLTNKGFRIQLFFSFFIG